MEQLITQNVAKAHTRAIDNVSGGPDNDAHIPDWRRPAALGYGLIVLTFFVLGGWSAVAKIDSAIVAEGVVTDEGSKKAVQHLEGGLVQDILVREGQHVEKGQVLFKISPTNAKAGFDVQRNQLDFALAQEARLIAERDGANEVSFPETLLSRRHDPNVAMAVSDQTKQFEERRASLSGQIDLLENKVKQYNTEIDGLKVERGATENQLKFINEELRDLNSLLDRQLVQKSRILALEREKSRLEGVIGRSTADQAKAETGIGEATLQIRQTRQKFQEDIAAQILDVRSKIADLREKLRVASDVLDRVDVTSPVTGTLQNLRIFTAGGVIKPGETLAEVVPDHDALIVQARVSPAETERLSKGMSAEVRFSAFRSKVLPLITGHVSTVSRDRLVDEATKQPYFLAQVVAEDIPDEVLERLTPGMPAEVVMATGERTILDYLVRPLKDRMRGAMRER